MSAKTPKRQLGQVRIISGMWRGRIIRFPPHLSYLRPTPSRIRETLFNWLAKKIDNAQCLDLFAGSGVLGFEALSRGASQITFIDHSDQIIKHLYTTAQLLSCNDITIYRAQLPNTELSFPTAFDIVFIDPPFHKDLINSCINWLENAGCLNHGAYIYIESEKTIIPWDVPNNWYLKRKKFTGLVLYQLYQRL